MSFGTSFFLALRYLKPKKSFTTITTVFAIVGPAIGVAVLIVVMSVMKGFHNLMRTNIFNMQAHLELVHPTGEERLGNCDELVKRLNNLGYKSTPVIEDFVMIQAGKKFLPKLMRGIDLKTDPDVTKIKQHVKLPQADYFEFKKPLNYFIN